MIKAPSFRTGLRSLAAIIGCVALLASGSRAALSAPQPEVVPKRWQLDVRPSDLRVMTVDVPGVGLRCYYYMTYLVTNNTGEDIDFFPSFELVTDDGRTFKSGRDVPRYARERIHRVARKGRIELLHELDAQGKLLQGPEHALEVLVIWPCENFKVDEVKVFMAGFSGETRTVEKPDTGEEVVLRKELMLVHTVPGEINPRGREPLRRIEDRWILR